MRVVLFAFLLCVAASADPVVYKASAGKKLEAEVHLREFWGDPEVDKARIPASLQIVGDAGFGEGRFLRIEKKVEKASENEISLWYAIYGLKKDVGAPIAALVSEKPVTGHKKFETDFQPVPEKERVSGVRKAVEGLSALDINGDGKLLPPYTISKTESGEVLFDGNGQKLAKLSDCKLLKSGDFLMVKWESNDFPYKSFYIYRNVAEMREYLPKLQYRLEIDGRPAYLFEGCSDGHGCDTTLWYETPDGVIHRVQGGENVVTC